MGLWDRLLTMANCPAVSGQHPGCSCTEGGPGDPSPVLRAAFVISKQGDLCTFLGPPTGAPRAAGRFTCEALQGASRGTGAPGPGSENGLAAPAPILGTKGSSSGSGPSAQRGHRQERAVQGGRTGHRDGGGGRQLPPGQPSRRPAMAPSRRSRGPGPLQAPAPWVRAYLAAPAEHPTSWRRNPKFRKIITAGAPHSHSERVRMSWVGGFLNPRVLFHFVPHPVPMPAARPGPSTQLEPLAPFLWGGSGQLGPHAAVEEVTEAPGSAAPGSAALSSAALGPPTGFRELV